MRIVKPIAQMDEGALNRLRDNQGILLSMFSQDERPFAYKEKFRSFGEEEPRMGRRQLLGVLSLFPRKDRAEGQVFGWFTEAQG